MMIVAGLLLIVLCVLLLKRAMPDRNGLKHPPFQSRTVGEVVAMLVITPMSLGTALTFFGVLDVLHV
jgi:sulfite exporter TauE/SafE